MTPRHEKPSVFYSEVDTLIDVHGGQIAVLVGVRNHPNLGEAPIVHTSLIKRLTVEHGQVIGVETRNTNYVRETRRGLG